MRVFDLHCDTVSACLKQQKSLLTNDLQLDLLRGSQFSVWIQTFAFWMDDRFRGEAAWNHFLAQYHFFHHQAVQHARRLQLWDRSDPLPGICNALLAVEGGAAIGGRLDRIELLKQMGISVFTLTWNGENELGGGADTTKGLTQLGRDAVRSLEAHQIVIDLSHASDRSFWDCSELAKRPFVATHSNARAICPHRRNLTDQQIRQIIANKGLIGLNFYPVFVTGEQQCKIEQLIPHVEHILSLGGEQALCLGSDFDGAAMPEDLKEIKKLDKLYENMLKYFQQSTVDRIFFQNASAFFERNENGRGRKRDVVQQHKKQTDQSGSCTGDHTGNF